MVALVQPEDNTLGGWFDWIYGSETGFAYVAIKTPGNQHQFQQKWFEWPVQKQQMLEHIVAHTHEREVYFAPALFSEASGKKEHVKGASVVWVEFDGTVPTDLQGLPEPTCRIRSSNEGHEHWYWRLEDRQTPTVLDTINRALTYMLGADESGWDAGQILRPPGTYNHKRQRKVELLEWYKEARLPVGLFHGLPQPPPPIEQPVPDKIPPIQDIVAKYQFTESVWTLFKNGAPEGQRSSALMALGYYCCEMNMSNEEAFAMLLNADERWGKFSGRQDQMQRLLEIVTRARQKYPYRGSGQADAPVPKLQPLGFLSLLRTEVNLEWVWEGFLQKAGYLLLTGPSGVGKTQFSLDAAGHFCNGRNFLDGTVTEPKRIGFFSLEMGLVDLKQFLSLLCPMFTQEEQELMEQNLQFFPLGEPIYLNRPEEKRMVEQVIGDLKLDGIMIDSLGSTTEGELTDEKDVKNLMDWNDRMRQQHNVFTWYIHHHRKASGDNKRPNKLADVYGSMYITARATTVACLWPTVANSTVEFLNLKMRLAPKLAPFQMHRDENLHFTKLVSGIAVPAESDYGKDPKENQNNDQDDDQVDGVSHSEAPNAGGINI